MALTQGTALANAQYTSHTRLHAEQRWYSTSWVAGASLFSPAYFDKLQRNLFKSLSSCAGWRLHTSGTMRWRMLRPTPAVRCCT